MIIDIPGTDLELKLETNGYVTFKAKGENGESYFGLNRAELLPVSTVLIRAYIAHIPTTKEKAR